VQIFILLAVGARHHKTVESAPPKFGSQFGNPRGALRTFARIIK
jgi:hypothetical protein